MIKDIQGIFESITPENIKDIPVIQDAMKIFIETLKEVSKESIDLQKFYENESIREELVKVYLDDLYNVLQQVSLNEQVIEAVDRINSYYEIPGASEEEQFKFINKDAILNIAEYINNEHFLTFRSYKQKKGTLLALEYIYELINNFASNTIDTSPLRTRLGDEPFNIEVDGSLPAEFYEYIIYPLAHPLGFIYTYTRYMSMILVDYFPEMNIEYDVQLLAVVCLDENAVYHVTEFIGNFADHSSENVVFNEIEGVDLSNLELTKIERYETNTYRTTQYWLEQKFYENGEVIQTNVTYLEQVTTRVGQTTVTYYDESGLVIHEFDSLQCSIYPVYTQKINTTVQDDYIHGHYVFNADQFERNPVSNLGEWYDPNLGQNNKTIEEDLAEIRSIPLYEQSISTAAFEKQNVGNETYIAKEHGIDEVIFNVNKISTHYFLDPYPALIGAPGLIMDGSNNIGGKITPYEAAADAYWFPIYEELDWEKSTISTGIFDTYNILENYGIIESQIITEQYYELEETENSTLSFNVNKIETHHYMDPYPPIIGAPELYILDNNAELGAAIGGFYDPIEAAADVYWFPLYEEFEIQSNTLASFEEDVYETTDTNISTDIKYIEDSFDELVETEISTLTFNVNRVEIHYTLDPVPHTIGETGLVILDNDAELGAAIGGNYYATEAAADVWYAIFEEFEIQSFTNAGFLYDSYNISDDSYENINSYLNDIYSETITTEIDYKLLFNDSENYWNITSETDTQETYINTGIEDNFVKPTFELIHSNITNISDSYPVLNESIDETTLTFNVHKEEEHIVFTYSEQRVGDPDLLIGGSLAVGGTYESITATADVWDTLIDDNYECGVYRDGIFLEDNNYAAWVA